MAVEDVKEINIEGTDACWASAWYRGHELLAEAVLRRGEVFRWTTEAPLSALPSSHDIARALGIPMRRAREVLTCLRSLAVTR